MAELKIHLGPLELQNPVCVSSGTYGYGEEFEDFIEPGDLGALFTKGITLKPRAGNPPPRIVETPSGMINSIGLENPGLEYFLENDAPRLGDYECKIIVNINGETIDEYADLAGELNSCEHIDGIELNASCPNVEKGGMAFGIDPGTLFDLTFTVRGRTTLPLIVKLTPNVGDIVPLAQAAVEGGGDILHIANTFLGMAIDVETMHSRLARDYGGLSGPAIRPLTLVHVHRAHNSVNAPIIGGGGIWETRDAIEYFIAGASAVSIGTLNYTHPARSVEIIKGISDHLDRKNLSLEQLIGSYKSAITPEM